MPSVTGISVADGGTTTYTTNNLNQYTAVNSTTHTYDQSGNLTNDETFTYTYDYENRLITAAKTGMSATYTYDAFGRRIKKEVNGIITSFIYDGDQVIGELDGSGALVAKYIYGPGIDEPISMERGGQTYYYHFDGLGSVTEITDSTGSTVEIYSYDVYGNTAIKDASDNVLTESAIGNAYAFTGRRLDTETGIYYYRARMYSPILGRFLQTDPIGYFGGINLYTYVGNNPINWIDPLGLDKKGNKGIFPGGNMPLGPDGELIGPTGPEDPVPDPPKAEEDTPKVYLVIIYQKIQRHLCLHGGHNIQKNTLGSLSGGSGYFIISVAGGMST